jgi:hypothetical protein
MSLPIPMLRLVRSQTRTGLMINNESKNKNSLNFPLKYVLIQKIIYLPVILYYYSNK